MFKNKGGCVSKFDESKLTDEKTKQNSTNPYQENHKRKLRIKRKILKNMGGWGEVQRKRLPGKKDKYNLNLELSIK